MQVHLDVIVALILLATRAVKAFPFGTTVTTPYVVGFQTPSTKVSFPKKSQWCGDRIVMFVLVENRKQGVAITKCKARVLTIHVHQDDMVLTETGCFSQSRQFLETHGTRMESGFVQESHSRFIATLLTLSGFGPLLSFVVVGTSQVQAASGDDSTHTTESCIVPGHVHNTLFVETKIHGGFVAGKSVLVAATSLRSCLCVDEFQCKRFVRVIFFPRIQFLNHFVQKSYHRVRFPAPPTDA